MSEALSPNEKASLPRFSKPDSLSTSPSSKNSSAIQSPVNPAKFKTQICKTFELTGTCTYNSKCLFAHGPKELRSPQSSPSSDSVNAVVVSMQAAGRLFSPKATSVFVNSDSKSINNTVPRQWSSSPYKDKEGGAFTKPASITVQKAIVLYKTELCRSYASVGSCPYGIKCQFAHGDDELRPVQRHKNYKTTKCEKFHSSGSCPFGLRCIFIHDEDERELPNSESYDPDYASRARQRRVSEQKLKIHNSKELAGEFLRDRFSAGEEKSSEKDP